MAGKLETQKQVEELQAKIVKLETENADLSNKLVNLDRSRTGATQEEISDWEARIKAQAEETERVKQSLLASDKERDELKTRVSELLKADSLAASMEDGSYIEMKPIPSMTGMTEPLPGVESMRMATFAMDMNGGGVVMVTVVNGVPVVSVLDRVKLSNRATGAALERRPEFR